MVELASRRAVSPSPAGAAVRARRRDDRLRRGRVHLQVPPRRPASQDWLALQPADRRRLWPGDICCLRLSWRRAGDRGERPFAAATRFAASRWATGYFWTRWWRIVMAAVIGFCCFGTLIGIRVAGSNDQSTGFRTGRRNSSGRRPGIPDPRCRSAEVAPIAPHPAGAGGGACRRRWHRKRLPVRILGGRPGRSSGRRHTRRRPEGSADRPARRPSPGRR